MKERRNDASTFSCPSVTVTVAVTSSARSQCSRAAIESTTVKRLDLSANEGTNE